MVNPLNLLRRKTFPLNTIYISKSALISNYKTLTKINSKIRIAPVLKSNAYGHGIELIGKILDSGLRQNDVPFLCVDSLYEGLLLRKSGVKSEILIMGYINPENLKIKRYNFSYAIWDLPSAQVINDHQKDSKVHIFVDTGMNREGVSLNSLKSFLSQLKLLRNLKVDGLMSHMSSADDLKSPQNALQLKNFKKAKDLVKAAGFKPRWFHLGGSYSLLNLNPEECNAVRVGKALYGVVNSSQLSASNSIHGYSSNVVRSLKPILTFKSQIVQIKNLKKGDKVGYSSTFTASKDLKIAVLPLGYNDGLDRRLSNKGFVRVEGVECKILGLISMNVTVIDISEVSKSFLGTEVLIFSDTPTDKNSIGCSARICQTISYEILVNLHPSTKRVVY